MASYLYDSVVWALDYAPVINRILPQKQIIIQEGTVKMSGMVRLAGASGALAICLGAYGSHVIRDSPKIEERRRTAFETGNRYHLMHSLALLAAHNAKYPKLTTSLLITGMILFCGPCYHYAISGNEVTRKFTPMGGITLIVAWLSFIL